VFSKRSFSVKTILYKLRIVLYALHESRICSTDIGQLDVPQYGLACFLVLEYMSELDKCDPIRSR